MGHCGYDLGCQNVHDGEKPADRVDSLVRSLRGHSAKEQKQLAPCHRHYWQNAVSIVASETEVPGQRNLMPVVSKT